MMARDDRSPAHPGAGDAPREDDLAQALEDEDNERHPRRASRVRLFFVVIGVLIAIAVAVALLWPRGPGPAAHGPPDQHTSGHPSVEGGHSDLGGADLLTAPWPRKAVAALRQDTSLHKASRLLLTRHQVQATGPASADGPGSGAWSDYVYVDDRALDLGDALLAPTPEQLFSLSAFDPGAITKLVKKAPALTGASPTSEVYVVVERDTVADGSPVRIEVYLTADGDTHIVTADAHGSVLDTH